MSLPLFIVDAFTDRPFAGNPAAVCLLDAARPDEWLHALAGEMNLSETAFLLPEGDGWRLRWMTPLVEVDLCGHATLASAHVLWTEGLLSSDLPAHFHTKSGLLTATKTGDSITLDFPAVRAVACEDEMGLAAALGATVRWLGKNGMDYLVEVSDERAVCELKPDMAKLAALPVRGVIVTARGEGDYDFVSRFFAPAVGVPEDPVTGSAHCALGPFWAERLGRTTLKAFQASERGGELGVTVDGERVLLIGRAVTVLRGKIATTDGTSNFGRK